MKKNYFIKLLCSLLILLNIHSINAQNTTSFEYDVYIAGSGRYLPQNSEYTTSYPKYIKNGVETSLWDETIYSGSANSIFVSGKDVYVAGTCSKITSSTPYYQSACYWKNGKLIILETGNTNSWVEAGTIYVKDGDVYVIGSINNDAILWINDKAINLTNNTHTSGYINSSKKQTRAHSIVVLPDKSIHIAGDLKGEFNGYEKNYAVHWTIQGNTVNAKILSPNTNTFGKDYEYATDISFYGNDIFISGYKKQSSIFVAKYWKNDSTINVDYASSLTSIHADSPSDIYLLGKSGSFYNYWLNGEKKTLNDASDVNDMFVIDKNVFVVGSASNPDTGSGAAYWKNGTMTSLSGQSMSTNSIFVTSNNAFLKEMSLNQGTLFPEFNPNETSYLVNVDNDIDNIDISAIASERFAKVTGCGNYTLNEGTNRIEITVTASNGETVKTYEVNVVRAKKSNIANLTSLTINPGTLTPQFSPSITSYLVNVPNDITGIAVSATAEHTMATVSGNGFHALAVGNNAIVISVTAENGTTIKKYTINVVRADIGHNADLKSLSFDTGVLSPDFKSSITDYKLKMTSDKITGIIVSSEAVDENANIDGNGYYPITDEELTIVLTVTAEDEETTKKYTIKIDKATNINTNIYSTNLKLYPNPIKEILIIETKDLDIEYIEILDLTGKLVYNQDKYHSSINLSHISSGVYLIKILTNEGLITGKVIKE